MLNKIIFNGNFHNDFFFVQKNEWKKIQYKEKILRKKNF